MPSVITSPEDLVNLALSNMGYPDRIGSIYEGSAAAKKALDVYSQERDELLRLHDYDFAEQTANLTLLKSAPIGGYFPPTQWDPNVNPPVGWLFEYAYPEEAIKIRIVKSQPLFILNADPRPTEFDEYNDAYLAPAARTIVTNVPNAIAVYTGRVTNPLSWDTAFIEAFAARLSVVLGPALGNAESIRITVPEAQAAQAQSEMEGR